MHLKKWFKQRGLARLIMEPQQLANKGPNTFINCLIKLQAKEGSFNGIVCSWYILLQLGQQLPPCCNNNVPYVYICMAREIINFQAQNQRRSKLHHHDVAAYDLQYISLVHNVLNVYL